MSESHKEQPAPGTLSRRSLLKLGGATAAAAAAAATQKFDFGEFAPPPAYAGVNEGSYEVLENGAGKFRVVIDGVLFPDVHEVIADPFDVDVVELDAGADAEYRIYGPGDAHYGSITIRTRVGKNSKELYQWWLDASRGSNIRKSISVICLKRDGSPARTFNYLDCFPTRWDAGDYSPSSKVACESVTCKMGRVELA